MYELDFYNEGYMDAYDEVEDIFLEGYYDALEEYGYLNEEEGEGISDFLKKHKKKIIAGTTAAALAGAGAVAVKRNSDANKALRKDLARKNKGLHYFRTEGGNDIFIRNNPSAKKNIHDSDSVKVVRGVEGYRVKRKGLFERILKGKKARYKPGDMYFHKNYIITRNKKTGKKEMISTGMIDPNKNNSVGVNSKTGRHAIYSQGKDGKWTRTENDD